MEDYPRTIQEFEDRFSNEESCRTYLVSLRWPDGFRCPHCQGSKAIVVRGTLFQCCACRHQTSATAGTVFQDTRKPLVMWYLGSYETAWTWLHKLRRAMVRPDRDRLSGWVEVDETVVGGLEEGVAGRQTESKALVVITAQADGPGIGRIRMRMIEDASGGSLHPFVQDCVEPGSTIHTDGWQGYAGLKSKGYRQEIPKIRSRRKEASELMPRVHRVASLLKRWLLGTHQGAVSHQHLAYYLDEFTFRFNRRNSKSRGNLFFRLIQQAVSTPPATYDAIVKRSKPATQSVGVR